MKIILNYSEQKKYLIDVTLIVDSKKSAPFYLQLAAWRPGRYELANFAQYLHPLESDSASIRKVTKDKWEVIPTEDSTEISYQFYANQPDAGGSLITEDFIYLNPINFIPKLENSSEAYELELNCPENYTLATSLEKESALVKAMSYEELIDSPIIASSNIQHQSYQIEGSTFHIWIQGNLNPNWGKIISDFTAFTEESIGIFGGFESPDYHFLNIIHPFKHYHGVEHLNSTVIVLGPDSKFDSEKMAADFLGISCHELFHFWNIKRIKPQELVDLDLSQEAYFDTGLVAEGLTTYYGDCLLGRSGVFSQEQYFNEINIYLQRHFQNFGRTNNSIAESSTDLWLDGYKLGVPDRKVSIYIKGALISLILDLKIREASNNEYSLDDVMRSLWESFGDSKTGYTLDKYRDVILCFLPEGEDLFNELALGKASILPHLKDAFKFIGCEINIDKHKNQLLSKFGFFVNPNNNEVYKVDPEAPQELVVTDKIISINDQEFDKELKEYPDEIQVVVERYGKELKLELKSSENHYFKNYSISQNVKKGLPSNNFNKWLNIKE